MPGSGGITLFRLKPVIIITVLVLAATAAAVADIVYTTSQRPTYTFHMTFTTMDEYKAFGRELKAMPGVGLLSEGYRSGLPVEADFRVTAPVEFPYGTASYGRNSMVGYPILLCLLVLGTLWGFALQKKVRQDGPNTE
jgi:hypothetical protein